MVQAVDVSHKMIFERIKLKAEKNFHELSNACISHEMRNPLNSICGVVQLMQTLL